MKVAAAKPLSLGLLCLLSVGALVLWGIPSSRASARSVQVDAVTVWNQDGQLELSVRWQWDPPAGRRGWKPREHLLSVSFDTRDLIFEAEEAPAGVGAAGETMERLEWVAGPNGARRLFVLPEGQDGSVRVLFRPVDESVTPAAEWVQVHVVFDHYSAGLWRVQTRIGGVPTLAME